MIHGLRALLLRLKLLHTESLSQIPGRKVTSSSIKLNTLHMRSKGKKYFGMKSNSLRILELSYTNKPNPMYALFTCGSYGILESNSGEYKHVVSTSKPTPTSKGLTSS